MLEPEDALLEVLSAKVGLGMFLNGAQSQWDVAAEDICRGKKLGPRLKLVVDDSKDCVEWTIRSIAVVTLQ